MSTIKPLHHDPFISSTPMCTIVIIFSSLCPSLHYSLAQIFPFFLCVLPCVAPLEDLFFSCVLNVTSSPYVLSFLFCVLHIVLLLCISFVPFSFAYFFSFFNFYNHFSKPFNPSLVHVPPTVLPSLCPPALHLFCSCSLPFFLMSFILKVNVNETSEKLCCLMSTNRLITYKASMPRTWVTQFATPIYPRTPSIDRKLAIKGRAYSSLLDAEQPSCSLPCSLPAFINHTKFITTNLYLKINSLGSCPLLTISLSRFSYLSDKVLYSLETLSFLFISIKSQKAFIYSIVKSMIEQNVLLRLLPYIPKCFF